MRRTNRQPAWDDFPPWFVLATILIAFVLVGTMEYGAITP